MPNFFAVFRAFLNLHKMSKKDKQKNYILILEEKNFFKKLFLILMAGLHKSPKELLTPANQPMTIQ